MKTTAAFALLIVLSLGGAAASATVTFDWATVGNPGNAHDIHVDFAGNVHGGVDYTYRISKHEVTNAQYTEFLNAVDPTGANRSALYNSNMSSNANGGINFNRGAANGSKYEIKSGRDNTPVVYVTFFDAMRFTNWLENGQGSGDTESGVYTIGNGVNEVRNPNAAFFIPSDDEWYKAAYHKNDGVTGNYWDWPTSTDNEPYSDNPGSLNTPDDTNVANFRKDDSNANGYDGGFAVTGSPSEDKSNQNYLTDVGAYSLATSPYGIFDQGGNASEWTEGTFEGLRRVRGGDWGHNVGILRASTLVTSIPSVGRDDGGFRVASIALPELPGDYNGNGTVEQADLDLVLLNWGNATPPVPDGWVNNLPSGGIDQGELDNVLLNWGNAASSVQLASGAGVPEPQAWILLMFSCVLGASSCGSRRASTSLTNRAVRVLSAILLALIVHCLGPQRAQAFEIPTTNLQVWLRADSIEGLSDGDAVVSWTDQSGNSNDAHQPSTRNQPTYRADGLNGMPTLLFDGFNDYLQITSNPGLEPQTLTAFIVAASPGDGLTGSGHDLFNKFYSQSNPYVSYALELRRSFNIPHVWRISGNYGGNWTTEQTQQIPINQPDVIAGVWDTDNMALFLDGAEQGEGTVTGSIVYNGGPLTIGSWLGEVTARQSFGGDIAEFLLYDTALSTDDRQFVEGSLAWKYGLQDDLPTDHPYRMVMPGSLLDGDYNGNGTVEQADLDLVLLNWGNATPPVPAGWGNDLPSGGIDQEELDNVLLNWGSGGPLGASSVPEPSSAMLLLVGVLAAMETSRRWRKTHYQSV